jgi:hypothetical protein
MGDPVEFQEKRMVSYGLMVKMVLSAIGITFMLSMIWARFLFMEKDFISMKESISTNIETITAEIEGRKQVDKDLELRINGRIDRKMVNHEKAFHHKDHVDVVVKDDQRGVEQVTE